MMAYRVPVQLRPVPSHTIDIITVWSGVRVAPSGGMVRPCWPSCWYRAVLAIRCRWRLQRSSRWPWHRAAGAPGWQNRHLRPTITGTAVSPRDAARIIRRSTEYLTDLVEWLLDMSMAEQAIARFAPDWRRSGSELPEGMRPADERLLARTGASGARTRVETPEGPLEPVLIARQHENEALIRLTEINPRTVQKHLERISEKLGVETRAAAAAIAIRSGGN